MDVGGREQDSSGRARGWVGAGLGVGWRGGVLSSVQIVMWCETGNPERVVGASVGVGVATLVARVEDNLDLSS